VRHHSFVSYVLYTIGFVGFTCSLEARARPAARSALARALRSISEHSLAALDCRCSDAVASLPTQKKSYMYQFGQFAWTHMILLVILLQSSFFVANIMEGLIWFVLPSSLVILNDIMARAARAAARTFRVCPAADAHVSCCTHRRIFSASFLAARR
jgi:hypothetical protein